jgi:hypothetical protein
MLVGLSIGNSPDVLAPRNGDAGGHLYQRSRPTFSTLRLSLLVFPIFGSVETWDAEPEMLAKVTLHRFRWSGMGNKKSGRTTGPATP